MDLTEQDIQRNRESVPVDRPPVPKRTGQAKMPAGWAWLGFVGILLVNFLMVRFLWPSPEPPVIVPYTLFKEEIGNRNVTAIFSRGETITGHFKKPVTYPPREEKSAAPKGKVESTSERGAVPEEPSKLVTSFTTTLPSFVDPGLEAFLIEHGVEISAKPVNKERSLWETLLYSLGPGLLFIGFYILMSRQVTQGGGFMDMGKSKAHRYDQTEDAKVTFIDVAGIDEAKNELVEIVDFLKDPQKYTRLGETTPKGVLLVGAPGTGKTLLARAVAGEAGVPFFSLSASEFVEELVGVGAARVRDLFKQARAQAPSIVFIDKLDAIGRAREQVEIEGSGEQEQTLNQILTEMDGFSSRDGIIVLAATNQPDSLDKALLRPGRFDRHVVVNLPDKKGREEILRVHTRSVPLANDANLGALAAATSGFSGADLKNLVNEAALMAARHGQNEVRRNDFVEALEKIALGTKRPLLLSRVDKERTAYHEGGHAILGLAVSGADPVKLVTIVPRGQALGFTYQQASDEHYYYPEASLRARIVGTLGGRAAEEVVYATKTTGAENDIEQATGLARRMVTRWGMSERLGTVQLAPRENPYLGGPGYYSNARPFSEETARVIDAEVLRIISECHEEAKRLLVAHRIQLDALAKALVDRETLDEQEIRKVTGLPSAPALETENLPDPDAESRGACDRIDGGQYCLS